MLRNCARASPSLIVCVLAFYSFFTSTQLTIAPELQAIIAPEPDNNAPKAIDPACIFHISYNTLPNLKFWVEIFKGFVWGFGLAAKHLRSSTL